MEEDVMKNKQVFHILFIAFLIFTFTTGPSCEHDAIDEDKGFFGCTQLSEEGQRRKDELREQLEKRTGQSFKDWTYPEMLEFRKELNWLEAEKMKEKEKMSALAPTDNPAPQPSGPEEAAHYVDEPEQTAVSTEKKYLNISGRWVGTYTITDHTGPDYGGVTYEYGTNEELVFSVNQAANSDQATVTAYGTECATTFNSESRKLEFTYKSNFQGSLIVTVFKGTVSSDLSTIEGTFVQTWPDSTKFSGNWRVRR